MRQFLKSLLNATLLLAVILAGLTLWLTYKIEGVAADAVTQIDTRAINALDTDIKDAVGEIRGLRDDLASLNKRLVQLIESPEIRLSPELRQSLDVINSHAKRIETAVTRFVDVDRQLSDRQIRKIGTALAEVVIDARRCRTAEIAP